MRTFFNVILGILSVIVGVALLMTDVISYIQPISALYILCPLTLFFSTLFILTLFLSVYWFCNRFWRMGIVGLLLLAASAPNMMKTYSLVPKYETKNVPDAISVMTYNVHLFDWFEGSKGVANAEKILDYVSSASPDVVCFQEFLYYPTGTYTLEFIKSKLPDYPYCSVEVLNNSIRVAKCVATFSKYPIVESEKINFNSSCHGALKSKIAVGADTLTVVNFYLKSNQLTQQEKDLVPDAVNPNDSVTDFSNGVFHKIYNKLVKASLERCMQADTLEYRVKDIDSKLVLCGDMNDIPSSYSYRTLSEGHNDAFLLMTSFSLGSTFHEGIYNFRIDYIFTSKDLVPVEFNLDNQKMSDHYPLTLKFKVNG